jgi:hypothetical protein
MAHVAHRRCGRAPRGDADGLSSGLGPSDDGFTDVDEADIFYADILWRSREEITKGCNPAANDLFCPDDPVSRPQIAVFLRRALG